MDLSSSFERFVVSGRCVLFPSCLSSSPLPLAFIRAGMGDVERIVPETISLSRRRRKWVSRDVSHFQQVEQVGEGTYGYVICMCLQSPFSWALSTRDAHNWAPLLTVVLFFFLNARFAVYFCAFSQVWSARDKYTNETVALKRVRMDNEREGVRTTPYHCYT